MAPLEVVHELVRARTRSGDERAYFLALVALLDRYPALELAVASNSRFLEDVRRWADAERSGASRRLKKIRESARYLERLILRASFVCTPRGGFADVVLADGWNAGEVIVRGPDQTIAVCSNVDDLRNAAEQQEPGSADDLYALSPVARPVGLHVRFWTVDRVDEKHRVLRSRVKLNAAANAVLEAYASRSLCTGGMLATAIADACSLDTVASSTVLSQLATSRLVYRAQSDTHRAHTSAFPSVARDAFVDTYRTVSLPEALVRAVDGWTSALPSLARVEHLARVSPRPVEWEPPSSTTVAELLDAPISAMKPRAPGPGWPGAEEWAEEVQAVALRAQEASKQRCKSFDLPAPDVTEPGILGWPADVLLRPVREGGEWHAIISTVSPVGVLDARFDGTDAVQFSSAQRDDYARFLQQLEAELDLTFVELVAPPHSRRAANATRRPIYTSWWTGDRDINLYATSRHVSELHYVALDDLRLTGRPGVYVHRHSGRTLIVITHATRTLLPPWNRISGLIGAVVRPNLRPVRTGIGGLFDYQADGVAYAPRVTMGPLIITPRQLGIRPGSTGMIDAAEILAETFSNQLVVARGSFGRRVIDPSSSDALALGELDGVIFEEFLPNPATAAVQDEDSRSYNAELVIRAPGSLLSECAAAGARAALTAALG